MLRSVINLERKFREGKKNKMIISDYNINTKKIIKKGRLKDGNKA
jgi:hypothetical protein